AWVGTVDLGAATAAGAASCVRSPAPPRQRTPADRAAPAPSAARPSWCEARPCSGPDRRERCGSQRARFTLTGRRMRDCAAAPSAAATERAGPPASVADAAPPVSPPATSPPPRGARSRAPIGESQGEPDRGGVTRPNGGSLGPELSVNALI